MVTNNTIKKHLQSSAPQPKNSEAFMADTIRQINLMPSPSSELQSALHRYTWMELLSARIDAVRWLIFGGCGTLLLGVAVVVHYDTLLSALTTWMGFFG